MIRAVRKTKEGGMIKLGVPSQWVGRDGLSEEVVFEQDVKEPAM